MELTSEEVARVFAMYLGIPISAGQKTPPILTYGKTDSQHLNIENAVALCDTYKILLTPLSSITDEHAIECYTLYMEENSSIFNMVDYVKEYLLLYSEITIPLFQYLLSQGYAVPLFFGVNHWANGKTPIELGIAIVKPAA